MSRDLTRTLRLVAALAAGLALAGCCGQVHRTITIQSEPSGAVCRLNESEVGRTPVTVPFTWYGTYSVRLEHPGYETLDAQAAVRAPAYQWIPLDLAFETVVPGIRRDRHAFTFTLQPVKPADAAAVLGRAEAFRHEARTPETTPPAAP
jgi:hypothetical protein